MSDTSNTGSVSTRLSIMMFIQFFIWGAWYVTGPNFLGGIGFEAKDFGWMYSVGPIAGMISPFFVGMIADRFFPVQRVLGVMHLLGAAFMVVAVAMMQTAKPNPNLINLAFFGHMLTYYPTLALTNTLAMRNMDDPEKQFPLIRVFGTIGWIAAGFALSFAGWSTSINMFYLCTGAAVALGLYSFALPHTPPSATGKVSTREILGLDAWVLLKNPSYLVFLIASTLICIPLSFYYMIASRVVQMADFTAIGFLQSMATALKLGDAIGAVMAFGQVSEIFFMLVMPFFFKRLGVKWMLAVGMLAWVLRYALFSIGAPAEVRWMIFIGILLHGICYDFFFVTGQIYTDKVSPRALRAQAQGLLVLFTLGLGMFIGAQIAGRIEAQHTPGPQALIDRVSAEGAAEALTARFGSEEAAQKVLTDWQRLGEIGLELKTLNAQLAEAGEADKGPIEAKIAPLLKEKGTYRQSELRAIEWRPLWGKPAIFAGIVMLIFIVVFKDKNSQVEKTAGDENA